MTDAPYTRSLGEWRVLYLLRTLGATLRTGVDAAKQRLTVVGTISGVTGSQSPVDVTEISATLPGESSKA
jgi:hypothetical protein